MTRTLALTFAALLLTAGCGGSGDDDTSDQAKAPAEPETTSVVVELRDTVPLEVLSNSDDEVCTSYGFDEIIGAAMDNPDLDADELTDVLPGVTVNLKDAAGTLLATQKLPEDGGTFDSGCTWPVTFDNVAVSTLYQVEVVSGTVVGTGQGDAAAGPLVVMM